MQKDEAEQLLNEMSRGSVDAFERFYTQFVSLVYQVALRIVGDHMEAEDICHDVFLEVYRKAGQYDATRGSVEAWLAVKTRSRCLDRLRRRNPNLLKPKESPERLADVGHMLLPPEEQVLARLERESVREAMKLIPEEQRQAVYGSYFQSYSHQELARQMRRPLGTIKSLVRYGLRNLKKQLEQMGLRETAGGDQRRE